MRSIPNIFAIARREFFIRARTRTFLLGTAILVVAVVVVAMLPVITRYVDRSSTERIGVWVGVEDMASDPVADLERLLNTSAGGTSSSSSTPDFKR